MARVTQHPDVPETVRSLHALTDLDYVDLFTVEAPDARRHAPAEWARAIMEHAPTMRGGRVLWRLLGLRLGPLGSPDHAGGWTIDGGGDDWVRASVDAPLFTGRAVVTVDPDAVSLSLAVRYTTRLAPVVWGPVSRAHQRGVPILLREAVQIMAVRDAEGDAAS
ncbi:MAG TPA: hypothetical protein VM618_10530 [Acidimicrobiia bacterium]|nr:hypothetical protein [Acidimicrobiia bacterium]